jgi:translation initiation factor 1
VSRPPHSRSAPARPSVVRVGRETQGRRGKGVTVIVGLPLPAPALEVLAGELKRRCGTGGTVRGAVIELQGEHRDAVVADLSARGYTVKRSGG